MKGLRLIRGEHHEHVQVPNATFSKQFFLVISIVEYTPIRTPIGSRLGVSSWLLTSHYCVTMCDVYSSIAGYHSVCEYVYIYIFMYIDTYIIIYIYVYIDRYKKREKMHYILHCDARPSGSQASIVRSWAILIVAGGAICQKQSNPWIMEKNTSLREQMGMGQYL
jgi:hypothetical protein